MTLPRALYTALLYLLFPAVYVRLLWRSRHEPAYRHHLGERIGKYRHLRLDGCIWVHAVSLGETRAAQPILERLLLRYPQRRILLTHMTPTGRSAGEQLYGGRVLRCYLPYDLPDAIRRFLGHFRPALGLMMETEVWPNLIAACRARRIPLYLVNARLSEKSYRGYLRLRSLSVEAITGLTGIAAQSEADAERFRALGAGNVRFIGNVKFDIAPDPVLVERGRQWRSAWGPQRPVFVAASTRDGEETLLLDALDRMPVPKLLTVIVPRHPQRFDEVARLLAERGIPFVRRSASSSPGSDTAVVLGDSLGEMPAYYAACDVAFLGGSLRPFGAHNLLEACALGKPVLIGPSVFNFQEAVALGRAAGAVVQIDDPIHLAAEAVALLQDRERARAVGAAGEAFTLRHRGAVERLFDFIGNAAGCGKAAPEPAISARATE